MKSICRNLMQLTRACEVCRALIDANPEQRQLKCTECQICHHIHVLEAQIEILNEGGAL